MKTEIARVGSTSFLAALLRYGITFFSVTAPSIIALESNFSISSPVKSTKYLEPYESGEVSRGEIGKFVHVQYYVIILLFVLFDVDMALLFPWAFDFKALGILPFINTLIFLAMPLFVVYYAFKEGHMRWMK